MEFYIYYIPVGRIKFLKTIIMKKLRMSLIFSKLVVSNPLITNIALMHNFIV